MAGGVWGGGSDPPPTRLAFDFFNGEGIHEEVSSCAIQDEIPGGRGVKLDGQRTRLLHNSEIPPVERAGTGGEGDDLMIAVSAAGNLDAESAGAIKLDHTVIWALNLLAIGFTDVCEQPLVQVFGFSLKLVCRILGVDLRDRCLRSPYVPGTLVPNRRVLPDCTRRQRKKYGHELVSCLLHALANVRVHPRRG